MLAAALAALAAAMALAGCAQQQDPGPVPTRDPSAPPACSGIAHTEGDTWTYRAEGHDGADDITRTVASLQERDLAGVVTPVVAFEERRAVEQAGQRLEIVQRELRRACDLALLEVWTNSTSGGTHASTHAVYDAPCADLRWPLATGASYEVRCEATTTHGSASRRDGFTVAVEVVGQVEVTVPAGTFRAHAVQLRVTEPPEAPHDPTTRYVAPRACADAKREGAGAAYVLVSFDCQLAP